MYSLIFSTTSRVLLPLLLLFSVFVLLRGHNEPGGGFVGGLVAASAFSLYAIAFGVQRARFALRVDTRTLVGLGLLLSASSGVLSLLAGKPFMTGLWDERSTPVVGHWSTPLMFDTGVYLLVLGITLTMIFTLAEE